MKKNFLILISLISIGMSLNNNSYADLNTLTCKNLLTKNTANIIYGNNFAKEEMSPNIWLFFQKISLVNNNLNLISIDDDKPIRQWQINLVSGKATLTPMFDPSSNWLCLNIDRELKKLEEQYKSGAMSGYEFEVAKKKLLKK